MIALALLLLAADSVQDCRPAEYADLAGEWILESNWSGQRPLPPARLSLGETKVSGFNGCNWFTQMEDGYEVADDGYTVSNGRVRVGNLAVTTKGCGTVMDDGQLPPKGQISDPRNVAFRQQQNDVLELFPAFDAKLCGDVLVTGPKGLRWRRPTEPVEISPSLQTPAQ